MEEYTGGFILLFLSRDFSNNREAYMLLTYYIHALPYTPMLLRS